MASSTTTESAGRPRTTAWAAAIGSDRDGPVALGWRRPASSRSISASASPLAGRSPRRPWRHAASTSVAGTPPAAAPSPWPGGRRPGRAPPGGPGRAGPGRGRGGRDRCRRAAATPACTGRRGRACPPMNSTRWYGVSAARIPAAPAAASPPERVGGAEHAGANAAASRTPARRASRPARPRRRRRPARSTSSPTTMASRPTGGSTRTRRRGRRGRRRPTRRSIARRRRHRRCRPPRRGAHRQADEHRTGGRRGGVVERPAHDRADLSDACGPRGPTSTAPGQPDQVARQQRVGLDVAVVLLPGGHHQRRAVGLGVGEVPDGVADARRGVEVEERRPPGGLGVAVGHGDGGGLLQGEDVVESSAPARASISGSSVVPGLPKMWRTPSVRRTSHSTSTPCTGRLPSVRGPLDRLRA